LYIPEEKTVKFLTYHLKWWGRNARWRLPVEDFKDVIYNFLEAHLQIDLPLDKIEFQRVHLLGKPFAGARPRPSFARFLRYGDKQLVMDRARTEIPKEHCLQCL